MFKHSKKGLGEIKVPTAQTSQVTLVPAKCTQCGAILDVDNRQDAAICTHCGMPFIVQKAINNYSVNTNRANICIANAHFDFSKNVKDYEAMGAAYEQGKIKERQRLKKEVLQNSPKIFIAIFSIFLAWMLIMLCIAYHSSSSPDNSAKTSSSAGTEQETGAR